MTTRLADTRQRKVDSLDRKNRLLTHQNEGMTSAGFPYQLLRRKNNYLAELKGHTNP
jgi:hypothetical protein